MDHFGDLVANPEGLHSWPDLHPGASLRGPTLVPDTFVGSPVYLARRFSQ